MGGSGKVLVTGGAGFIGSHTVVQLVNAGLRPVIVDDLRNSDERTLKGLEAILGRQVPLHRIDCNDEQAMSRLFQEEGDISGVIHFAAYKAVGESVQEPLKYFENNIGSLVVLLKLMQRHQVKRLVFSSSCTVYGQPEQLPVTEDSPDGNATSPYGFTKVACERLLRDHCHADPSLKVVLLRYFNPIGAHPSGSIGELPLGVPNNLVPFVAQTAAGIRQQLTVNGADYDTVDGSCVRDYIHVMDLADAHVRSLEWMDDAGTNCDVFNIGTGSGNSVLQVVNMFQEVNGVKVPHVIGPRRPGDVPAIYADTTRSREVLGWTPRLGMADALKDAWKWQINIVNGQSVNPRTTKA